jgi:regulator of protease activity HflC (stomatin/prohibitin superfamily)
VAAVWILIAVTAIFGGVLLVRSLRDVRTEVGRTVESFSEFRAALVPALVVLRDETRDVALRIDDRRPGSARPSH